MKRNIFAFFFIFSIGYGNSQSVNVAREFNKLLLNAITNDFARPTVHARNLFHLSAMTYDIYAVYYDKETYFLGKVKNDYYIPFDGKPHVENTLDDMKEAISFASFRLLVHRFQNSPGFFNTYLSLSTFMTENGYDISVTSADYLLGGAAEFGNYVAQHMIAYGLQDGANEANDYANIHYQSVNPPLEMINSGNPDMIDPNAFQPIDVPNALDQAGNPIFGVPPHLSPEWGNVTPFSLHDSLKSQVVINEQVYNLYCDPGAPPFLDTLDPAGLDSYYKWNFCMVPIWQSHLDPSDGVAWDISPNVIGNHTTAYPSNYEDIVGLYDYFNGGHNNDQGHAINPKTGQPYIQSIVRRADYARVLAEFWADGLDSETPPGHWFKIYHEISEHPEFEFKWMGEGVEMDILFYDILAHFALGGMMHDAAITAWSIKGRYNYVRPASAIRYMADKGQCTDPNDLSFHPAGLPIIPGYIELVYSGDPLAGINDEHVGKMKLYTWRGPDYIDDPENDYAGVGWILAENWWPYQRPSFVTPPFAGYISGHSTYSTTAANVLALITGDPYFPGGLGVFTAVGGEFLEFENGPTSTVKLQWATYMDAANQCSLSRIWGGIHPPVDDIPGRIIGNKIGVLGTHYADSIISINKPMIESIQVSDSILNINDIGDILQVEIHFSESMNLSYNPSMVYLNDNPLLENLDIVAEEWVNDSIFKVSYQILNAEMELFDITLQIDSAFNTAGVKLNKTNFNSPFVIDLVKPGVNNIDLSTDLISQLDVNSHFFIDVMFTEKCSSDSIPMLNFIQPNNLNATLVQNQLENVWLSDSTYRFVFDVVDNSEQIQNIVYEIDNVYDIHANKIDLVTQEAGFTIDTEAPLIVSIIPNKETFNQSDIGFETVLLTIEFSKAMDVNNTPEISFLNNDVESALIMNSFTSMWLSPFTYTARFDLSNVDVHAFNLSIQISNCADLSSNQVANALQENVFNIDTRNPTVISSTPSDVVIYDGNVGENGFYIDVKYSEPMDVNFYPFLNINHPDQELLNSIVYNPFSSIWLNDTVVRCYFNVQDADIEIDSLDLQIGYGKDKSGNTQTFIIDNNFIDLDTKNPSLLEFYVSSQIIDGSQNYWANIQIYDEPMDETSQPMINFSPMSVTSILEFNDNDSYWIDDFRYNSVYSISPSSFENDLISLSFIAAKDKAGNLLVENIFNDYINFVLSAPASTGGLTNGVLLFPNPASPSEIVTVLFDNPVQLQKISLYDYTGRLIKSFKIDNMSNKYELLLPFLSKGNYFLMLESNEYILNKKLVIK